MEGTLKRYLITTALVAFALGVPGARANTVITFGSPSNPLGTSQSYGTSPAVITAYGETCTSITSTQTTPNTPCSATNPTSTALYTKTDGLGLANGSNDDITFSQTKTGYNQYTTTYDFVQVDFSAVKNLTSIQFQMSDLSAGATWAVYGSNSAGTLGTLITSTQANWGTANSTTLNAALESIPTADLSLYKDYSFVVDCTPTLTQTVLLDELSITSSASPEPGTCFLMGIALAGFGVVGKKLRRRS